MGTQIFNPRPTGEADDNLQQLLELRNLEESESGKEGPGIANGIVPKALVKALTYRHSPRVGEKSTTARYATTEATFSAARIVAGRMYDILQIQDGQTSVSRGHIFKKLGSPVGTLRMAHRETTELLKCDVCGSKVTRRRHLDFTSTATDGEMNESTLFQEFSALRMVNEIYTRGKDLLDVIKERETDNASHWHAEWELEGVRLEFAHHGRMGQRPWTRHNIVGLQTMAACHGTRNTENHHTSQRLQRL
jgi:hypothetical protein